MATSSNQSSLFASLTEKGDFIEEVRMIRAGLHADAIEQLSNELNVPVSQLLSSLKICRRIVNRRKADGETLSPEITEKIVRAKRIYLKAFEVMKEEDSARDWLNREDFYLDGESPLSMLDTAAGANAVMNLLNAIEEGIPL